MASLPARLARLPLTTVSGEWQRHIAARHTTEALVGRTSTGRWGARNGFPVLYLGRPRDSVVVEAYRHIIDPLILDDDRYLEDLIASLVPRVLVTCDVRVTNLLDLRNATARADAGLTKQDLACSTDDQDTYERCRNVAEIAHQLGRHGILAPAATGLGETLALFMDLLPANEHPERCQPDEPWVRLPDDPRIRRPQLRLVIGNETPPSQP